MEVLSADQAIKYIDELHIIYSWADCKQEQAAIDLAKVALEKQISKKPKKMEYVPLIKEGWKYSCPNCGCAVGENKYDTESLTDKDNYCCNCGQALRW